MQRSVYYRVEHLVTDGAADVGELGEGDGGQRPSVLDPATQTLHSTFQAESLVNLSEVQSVSPP